MKVRMIRLIRMLARSEMRRTHAYVDMFPFKHAMCVNRLASLSHAFLSSVHFLPNSERLPASTNPKHDGKNLLPSSFQLSSSRIL